MSETVDIPVEGMTCASCVNRVSKGLGSVPGVEAADVNLATGRATVTFDPAQATTIDLRSKVEDLGYQSPPEQQHDHGDGVRGAVEHRRHDARGGQHHQPPPR